MGFKLSDLDVKIKKGYIQADVGYEEVTEDKKNLTFCDQFEAAMKEGPFRAFQSISKEFPEMAGLAK